ncbi:hypothetical protein PCASD_04950 [Puccinia coronata f. sp. avenae]|uniref:Proline dehydrogenase n=1 Tax=Puccinia coronata f. sp. avenae TaxID=200324 RepID=A0A2N5S1J2_9BASI|nr:hypothetical protein PCASD_25011 [Puccinia coronata f. sp. avenae]PLW47961.1 hypothetical protein PCASD_04950 [Puccinia coronata f. sp. avenae]
MFLIRLGPLRRWPRSARLTKSRTPSDPLQMNGRTAHFSSRILRRPGRQLLGSGLTRRPLSYGLSPARPSPRYTLLATTLGLGALVSGATVYALEGTDASADPLAALIPDTLRRNTTHVAQKTMLELLRSYFTLLMCEIPGVATYGPILLNQCMSFRDNVPVLGPAAWSVVEWFVYHTFFSHYTGGVSVEDCQPVMNALYAKNMGSLLNYSVEALERTGPGGNESELNGEVIAAISRAMDSLASYEISGAKGTYAPCSARMKPTAVAIKVSGLVSDPDLFKRASQNLQVNGVSPFRLNGPPFPTLSSAPDPLSRSDHLALDDLLDNLRSICRKAKASQIPLMIDAEYSWFQPALDRIATFLSAEFNSADPIGESYTPTVFNTFQALLRSSPARLAEFLDEGQQRGFSIGVKLVRGAYLVSETTHWREARAAGRPGVPNELPVWASKAETDACFDALAASLVQLLASNARSAEGRQLDQRQTNPFSPIEVAIMIAGHNPISAAKVLKQLRDKEGLARNIDGQIINLSDSLRGRLMFAQLYGMADNLTSTLTHILVPTQDVSKQSQPFVFKYLPFGPVDKVLPYLARRAEENSSLLEVKDGDSVLSLERKVMGKEIRKRIASFFILS